MTDVLVIGYGSELRRDDAAGRRVAEAIARLGLPGVTVLTSTQLVPEHVEAITAADRIVFIDASVRAQELSVHPLPSRAPPAGSHHTTPAELLELASALGEPCPPALLVEVPAFDVSLGEGLSAAGSVVVGDAVAAVAGIIRELTSDPGRARTADAT